MAYKYVVLGAGRQGGALAYDLARNCRAGQVVLADADERVAQAAVARLTALLPERAGIFSPAPCDAARPAEVAQTITGADVVVSAAPYRFNVELTDAAVAAGASFCDLGGNTAVVQRQLERHAQAVAAGVSIVPDCGLAPGLGNHLAAHGVQTLEEPQEVHIRCGGLPVRPVGPLGLKLVFNFQGLLNEYSGFGEFLRDGRLVEIPALTEVEEIEFPAPAGRCEAAVTSGGTSTCPLSYLGRLQAYDYKTVRYPGHFAIVRALFELGCFEQRVALSDGTVLEPKAMLRSLMEERLRFPDVHDLVVLRTTVSGRHEGRPRTLQYDLLDHHDEATGFTAMERSTAFPAAVVAHMQARGLVSPGAQPLEKSVPAQQFLDELPRHDIRIQMEMR
ncbi:MAG: saccharopine dehydrogenase NADP-binding domain-containing protein [Planctomycetes bacterium]|nr:saccharopine dehydrogenase NADP-binding domain-containing protein [Planctomycetota bacterium]